MPTPYPEEDLNKNEKLKLAVANCLQTKRIYGTNANKVNGLMFPPPQAESFSKAKRERLC